MNEPRVPAGTMAEGMRVRCVLMPQHSRLPKLMVGKKGVVMKYDTTALPFPYKVKFDDRVGVEWMGMQNIEPEAMGTGAFEETEATPFARESTKLQNMADSLVKAELRRELARDIYLVNFDPQEAFELADKFFAAENAPRTYLTIEEVVHSYRMIRATSLLVKERMPDDHSRETYIMALLRGIEDLYERIILDRRPKMEGAIVDTVGAEQQVGVRTDDGT